MVRTNMTEDEKKRRELRHDMNDHLAVIGAFLGYCESIEISDDFKEVLSNANLSYKELLEVIETRFTKLDA